jgi:hypothetical protein
MPRYEFKHKETGEVQELSLSVKQYDEWKANNPDWERFYSSAPGLVSQAKSTLSQAGKDWESHLTNIKKGAGRNNTINT